MYRVLDTRYFSCHPGLRESRSMQRRRICGAALRKTPAEAGFLSFSFGARRLRGAYRRLPLFLELSSGGGASRPRKVVHYLQPCAGAITRLCAWRRSHALSSFFFFTIFLLFSSAVLNRALLIFRLILQFGFRLILTILIVNLISFSLSLSRFNFVPATSSFSSD